MLFIYFILLIINYLLIILKNDILDLCLLKNFSFSNIILVS